MGDSKQIKIGVDASDYESNLQRIKASAEDLSRDMINSARAYSTSSKEVLSDIEDQIKAIEKRNRLDAEFRRESLRSRSRTGEIDDATYKRQSGLIESENKEDKIQTQLLRELIQTIKNTAKEEVRADRENVERELFNDKNVNKLKPEGDEKEILKRTIQKGLLPEGKKPEEDVREKGLRFQNLATSIRDGMNAVIGSGNMYESTLNVAGLVAKAAAGSAIPGIASAGIIAEAAVNASLKDVSLAKVYEDVLARNYAINGKDITGLGLGGGDFDMSRRGRKLNNGISSSSIPTTSNNDVDVVFGTNVNTFSSDDLLNESITNAHYEAMKRKGVRNMTDYGYSIVDVGNEKERMSRAMGSAVYSGEAAEDSLILQRMGVGGDETANLERLLRRDKTGQSAMEVTKKVMGSMQSKGMIKDGDTSMLPEYLKEIVGISQQQLSRLGQIDMGVNIRVAGAISGLSDNIASNPAAMTATRQALSEGLGEGGTPQMQALKYSILSRAKKKDGTKSNLDLWGMGMVMEDSFSPFAVENAPTYTQDMMSAIKKMSMGSEMMEKYYVQGFFSQFSKQKIESLKGVDWNKFTSDLEKGVMPTDIDIDERTKGQRLQGKSDAEYVNDRTQLGISIVKGIEDLAKLFASQSERDKVSQEQAEALRISQKALKEAIEANTRERK